ncbi:MAG TPA: diacylglycerol kinase family protein [Terriglobales bacterium]|nr:diacylglycerol kinase family protein [Terriglobales bacterium]
MSDTFLAVVNPAAGGGRCRKLVAPALDRLRSGGIALEIAETNAPGHASQIVRQALARGFRKFIAVGGDGTSYEIVNGLFPQDDSRQRPTLAFLPLGTGNSFLREFTERGVEHAIEALLARRSQPCDVLRMRHAEGVIHYINLLSMGFAADVAALRARRFRSWGELGYQSSILISLLRLQRRPFPLRVDNEAEIDRRPCLFLTFNNSKFTGGTMMIAPQAEVNDGFIEYVRWGPIGRFGLIRNLPTLYDGTHIQHPLAERRSAKQIDFYLDAAVDVMVDGEVLSLQCKTLDVLPSVIDVVV